MHGHMNVKFSNLFSASNIVGLIKAKM